MIKIFKSNFAIKLRNFLNIKPVDVFTENIPKIAPISDFFPWRADDKFETIFKFTDFKKLSTKESSKQALIYIFDNNGELISLEKINDLKILNQFKITKLSSKGKKFGSFLVFVNNEEIPNNFRNSCYTGFSYNRCNPSFIHGNIPVSYFYKNKIYNNLIGKSFFKNNVYRIQDYFDGFEKVELVFSNPTNSTISFNVNNQQFKFGRFQTKIVDVTNFKNENIISNCNLLRPYIFKYNHGFIDVHHA